MEASLFTSVRPYTILIEAKMLVGPYVFEPSSCLYLEGASESSDVPVGII